MIPYNLNPLGIDSQLSDLDILRQIRDANPTSQLPTLWLDSEDPYTQWEGVTWNAEKTKCISLDVSSKIITSLSNVNKLSNLEYLYCNNNQLTELVIDGLLNLKTLFCNNNLLTILNCYNLTKLSFLYCYSNNLSVLNVSGLTSLQQLYCNNNQLPNILTLISRLSITIGNADFNNNKFDTAEVNRLLGIGFTAAEIGTQNP